MKKKNEKQKRQFKIPLFFYDLFLFILISSFLFGVYRGDGFLTTKGLLEQSCLAAFVIFGSRLFWKIYRQIWRYGGIQCYIKLLLADACAYVIYILAERILPMEHISFAKILAFCTMNTLAAMTMRMMYRYAYKCGNQDTWHSAMLRFLLKLFSQGSVETEADSDSRRIKIAIIGAGAVGVGLAEDLISNRKASYIARCFIDTDPAKIGRDIHGLSVYDESQDTMEKLKEHHIQEVVFAVPDMDSTRKLELFDAYWKAGFKIKVFDYPNMDIPGKKRQLREFDIEDLLMRAPKSLINDQTREYYKGKKILITGGGGSIGSELCRQLAKMGPKQLIIFDIYENCAYDLQQSLKFHYKDSLDVRVEIGSIANKGSLARVFSEYHPDICINAAAHKHVPLMEKNCVEAVENNVFGALNVIQCCEEYDCGRFMMVSTDKAVNPTNVMGATKRVCEMIMQAYSTRGIVKCSATRFGNVLGSAGSVIPLFKRQIAAGGPVTLTDKRIIRYFMTIPEASQLVLTSGAMAENGELFVLDMGKPVRIYDLAKNMIALSGIDGVEIIETGLRPGEKLYEELLVQKDDLEKTDNDLIYIEREPAISMKELEQKLSLLELSCRIGQDDKVREALHQAVPTYRTPEEVNKKAEESVKQFKIA